MTRPADGEFAVEPVQPGVAPTIRRLQIGGRLRQLREAKKVTRAQAGYVIRGSESKISWMELGRVSFKERDLVDLLKLYGLDDAAESDRLIALARKANAEGWWHAPTVTCWRAGFRTISIWSRRRN